MTIYARCVAFVGRSDDLNFGAYTLGKEYEVIDIDDGFTYADFTIIDDEGHPLPCWWNSDPDVIWERVER